MQEGQLLGGCPSLEKTHVQLECDIHSDLTDRQASVLPDVTEQIPEAGCMCCSTLTLPAEQGDGLLTEHRDGKLT